MPLHFKGLLYITCTESDTALLVGITSGSSAFSQSRLARNGHFETDMEWIKPRILRKPRWTSTSRQMQQLPLLHPHWEASERHDAASLAPPQVGVPTERPKIRRSAFHFLPWLRLAPISHFRVHHRASHFYSPNALADGGEPCWGVHHQWRPAPAAYTFLDTEKQGSPFPLREFYISNGWLGRILDTSCI